MTIKMCPHCKYDCPKEFFEEHLKSCDEEPSKVKKNSKSALEDWDFFFKSSGVLFLLLTCLAIFSSFNIFYYLYLIVAFLLLVNVIALWIRSLVWSYNDDFHGWFVVIIIFGWFGAVAFYYLKYRKYLRKKLKAIR